MSPATSIATFIEDYVEAQVARGVEQYVILGAGLDTFAQRRPEIASRLRVFEVDRVASLAPGSSLVMSFMLPFELADPDGRPGIERAAAGARTNGTPFISLRPSSSRAASRRDGSTTSSTSSRRASRIPTSSSQASGLGKRTRPDSAFVKRTAAALAPRWH